MSWARARHGTAGLTVPQARHGPSKLNRGVPGQESRHGVLARHGTARGLAVPCLGTVEPCRAQACLCRAGTARPNGHVYVSLRPSRSVGLLERSTGTVEVLVCECVEARGDILAGISGSKILLKALF